jgi:sec-independent protein translocase protein TatC
MRRAPRAEGEAAPGWLPHLHELRLRLFVSAGIWAAAAITAYAFYGVWISLLIEPLAGFAGGAERLYAGTVFEAFIVRIKTSLLAGFCISLPLHIANALGFILPGLRTRERRAAVLICFIGGFLGLAGAYLGYRHLVPVMLAVLAGAGLDDGRIGYILGLNANLSFLLGFLGASALVSQLPLVLDILLFAKILKRRAVLKAGRYVVIGIFVLSAAATPSPDAVSQLMLALPLLALFYGALGLAGLMRWGED